MKEFPPFRLDPINQILWRTDGGDAGEVVPLSPKAFDVLAFLAGNPDRLITHEELLDALWPAVHVHPEVIKSQILAVRQALGDDVKAPRFVQTVRGRGYRFIAAVRRGDKGTIAAPVRDPLRLVGRAAPLADLEDHLHAALTGERQCVFIAGEPGIGKTALIETVLARAAPQHHTLLVAKGQCIEGFGGTEPYYPMLEALGGLCESAVKDVIADTLVSLAPSWAMQLPAHIPLDRMALLRRDIGEAGRERMLREIGHFLDVISAAHPLLLVFEDLHWADYSTVDLLSALARRRVPARLMILGSYRTEDTEAGVHPVKQVAHALALRKLCHEIELAPLGAEAVADYLAGGNPAAPVALPFAALIQSQSGGNPLFMTATLDHLAERGLVEQTDGAWHSRATLDQLELGIPDSLLKVIEARISRLTAGQCAVLQAAALAGATFRPAIAAAAIDGSDEAFEDICEDLSRRALFIRRDEARAGTGEGTYSFRHALYRQALYDRQGPLRRAQGHRRIGDRLEASCPAPDRSAIAAELVRHFSAAGDWAHVLPYLRLSLQTAKRRFANREAMAILDQASVVVQRLPEEARAAEELTLLEARAGVLMVEHDPATVGTYERVVAAAHALGDADAEARSLLGLAYAAGWHDRDQALAHLDRALEISRRHLDASAQARTEVSSHAWKIWIGGWNEDSAARCQEALTRLQAGDDPVAAAWASIEASTVYLMASRYREAQEMVKVGYQRLHLSAESHPEYSLERAVWSYFLGVPLSYVLLGEFDNALASFESGIALFTRSGNTYAVSALRLYRAWLWLHCGAYEAVIEACAAVTSEHGEPPPPEQRLLLLLTGLAHSGLGDWDAARARLSEVQRQAEAQPVMFDWHRRMLLEHGLAHIALMTGRTGEARAHADTLISVALATADRTWHGLAWDARARVALAEDDPAGAGRYSGQALAAIAGFTTPLADWPCLATAAAAQAAQGDEAAAASYAAASEAQRARLIASLPEDSPLRASLRQAAGFGESRPQTPQS